MKMEKRDAQKNNSAHVDSFTVGNEKMTVETVWTSKQTHTKKQPMILPNTKRMRRIRNRNAVIVGDFVSQYIMELDTWKPRG